MSQFFPPIGGLIVGFSGAAVFGSQFPAASDVMLFVVAFVWFVVGFVAWLASPLPNGTTMAATTGEVDE